MRLHGLVEAWRRAGGPVAVGLLLIVVAWWWVVLAIQERPGDWAFDFRQFWQGGRDVLSGVSPYPSPELLATAGGHLSPVGIQEVFRFPYPAGAAVGLAPLGLLEFEVAAAVWGALLIVSFLAALWILRVRDWRVLAVVATSFPVISSVRLGTFTPLLVLLLAVAWRWRERRWVAGSALGVAVALKLFLWPLVVWLAATRRWREAAAAAVVCGGVTLGAWAAIGFDGLAQYPELVRRLAEVVQARGFSLVALGTEAGLPERAAETLPWLVGLPLLGLAADRARRNDEIGSFTLALVSAVALTPIVWLHYFALLAIPLALVWTRFAWPWTLLWVFWLAPGQQNEGELSRLLLALGVVAAVAVAPTIRGRWRAA